jgi:hypothetical protein
MVEISPKTTSFAGANIARIAGVALMYSSLHLDAELRHNYEKHLKIRNSEFIIEPKRRIKNFRKMHLRESSLKNSQSKGQPCMHGHDVFTNTNERQQKSYG